MITFNYRDDRIIASLYSRESTVFQYIYDRNGCAFGSKSGKYIILFLFPAMSPNLSSNFQWLFVENASRMDVVI